MDKHMVKLAIVALILGYVASGCGTLRKKIPNTPYTITIQTPRQI